jgi:uridine kinase
MIIVEGILVFAFPELLPLFAYSVFVDTSETVRLERRIQRDIRERGRTKESVLSQWQQSVQPMYNRYCRPLRNKASEVFPGEQWSIEDVTALLKRIIAR